MIKAVVFEDKMERINDRSYFAAESKLECFCETNRIAKDDIISISLSSDKNANYNKILLVYSK